MAGRERNGNDPPEFGMIFLQFVGSEHRSCTHGPACGISGWPAAINERSHNRIAFSAIAVVYSIESRFNVVNRRESKTGADRPKFLIGNSSGRLDSGQFGLKVILELLPNILGEQ